MTSASCSWNAAISSSSYKHYITEPEDYKIFLSYLRDIKVHRDTAGWENIYKNLGDDGLPHTSIGRTPFQQLWIQWVSIQDLSLHIIDCPELMEEVFDEMFRVQRDMFLVLREVVDLTERLDR